MMIYVCLYFLLLAFNIWFFLIRPKEPLADRITVLLQVIGVYTFAFGVLAQTGILRNFEVIASDMTSSDLFSFLRGNFVALSILFSAEAMGMSPHKSNIPLTYSLEFVVLILMFTVSFLFSLFYLIVVLPLSYIAYVIVSIPVNAMLSSARDFTFRMNGSEISIKNVVAQNIVTIKNLMIAVPAIFLSLTLKISQLYRKSLLGNALAQKMKDWFSSHTQTANILLLVFQALLILIAIVHTITAISSFSVMPAGVSGKIGEIIGVVLVNILILSIFMLLYLKVRSYRKSVKEK